MPLSDEQLKELVYSLMIEEWPEYLSMSEVMWEQHPEEMEDADEETQDQLLDRLRELIRTAEVTITWPESV